MHDKRNILAAASVAALLTAGGMSTAAAQDTITLGAALSLTGKYATLGQNTHDGYTFAIDRINERGGVKVGDKSYQLAIAYYDDESTAARGAQLVERLVEQDKVNFVLGPYSSALTKAIAPVTEKYKIPMVQANAASRSLFEQGYRYMFAVLNTSDYYLRPAVDLLAELAKAAGKDPKSLRIAVAVENDNFSRDVRDGVIEAAESHGMEVVIDDKLPPDLNNMTSTLTKVKALKPDALLISGHNKGAILGVRQVAEQRVYAPMLALTQCKSAQIVKKFGKDADYAYCGAQWDSHLSYTDRWFGDSQKFAADFEKEYKYDPPYQVAESAAAVEVFADAIERAGSLDREKVRDALAATRMETFFGPVRFDETGKNIGKSMVMYQIQDGQYVVVAPTKWATSKPVYPAPSLSERM